LTNTTKNAIIDKEQRTVNAMKKLKIYLDTSVVSHLDHEETSEKMQDTKKLWEYIKSDKYQAILSRVTLDELKDCPEPKQSRLFDYLSQIEYSHIEVTDEIMQIAEKFIDFGILKEKSFDDCQHIAAAIVTSCDVIVSWNFRHIVNHKTINGVKVISTLTGYRDLAIYTPTMLIQEVADDE
jgi:predicted nucleic acid-binding protein